MTEKAEELRRHGQWLRRYGPKKAGHPSIKEECPACHKNFKEGDFTTLLALGPGNDPKEQKLACRGRPYTAVAVEVHYACATGQEEKL